MAAKTFTDMKIEIESFTIETNEHGKFNLVEHKLWLDKTSGKEKISTKILCYSVGIATALKRIVHMNLHNNPNRVTLNQFLVEYKNETQKIHKLFDLQKLK